MTTWEEIRDRLRRTHELDLYGASWTYLRCRSEQGVRVRVKVVRIDTLRAPAILLAAEIGAEWAIDHRQALLLNERLAVGALALTEGGYILRRLLFLAEPPWPELERDLAALVDEAAALRTRRPHATDAVLFDAYAR